MKYRRLGRTSLKVSVIGIGGGSFNPNKDPNLTIEEANEVISHAVKSGANLIDTGKEYDEKFISKAMGKNKERLHIVTKSEARNKKEMIRDIKDSLKKLGVGCIDIYQMHMVQSVEDFGDRLKNGVVEGLHEAKKNGWVNFTGIFSHRIEVLIEAMKTNDFDVVTVLYNAGHTLAEKLFKYTKKYDVGVLVAAPLGNGILADPKVEEERPNPGAEIMTVQNALKFILSNNNVSSVLVGSRRLEHAEENFDIDKIEWNLPETERRKITEKIKSFLGEKFCRGCRYCEPCAEFGGSLPISDILKLKILYEKYGYKKFAKWQFSFKQKAQGIKPCTGCGKCEPRCPYGIPIVKELQKAYEILSD
ncbi:MAG: aldo/keto reductase [Candidatus Aenigmarchaeota archaeon]|nr:aldo/keto reductase [Candidatus Aenigmarchaeota archaeon]